MKKGTLFLIPSFLSQTNPEKVFPAMNREIISTLDVFIVEELRTARRFLRKMGYNKDFEDVTFHLLNEHTEIAAVSNFLNEAEKGKDTGLLSEAGTPCIADPGAQIVRIAHSRNIKVVPLTGPSSILLALVASGFNGQNFAFQGYLPVDKRKAAIKIKELENDAWRKDQTQIFIETPYRNLRIFDLLLKTCRDDTLLCIAAGLTSGDEFVKTLSIKKWKEVAPPIHKVPAVFLIYNGNL